MHLTDEQLNEYLDHEASDRAPIELHLSSCADCAARLAAFQDLFAEIESLPELTLPQDLAARFIPSPNLPAKLPRSLTLTVTLQAALVVAMFILAAPFIMNLASSHLAAVRLPSIAEIFIQIRSQWIVWLDAFSALRLGSGQIFQLPSTLKFPTIEISRLMLALTLVSVSLLWVLGNGLLLRKHVK